nr:hypothetical protein FA04_14590 [Ensifer adhaerens]
MIAADTIESLCYDDVELAAFCIHYELLDTRTKYHIVTGDSRVVVGAHLLPFLACGQIPTDAKLILNRLRSLKIS